MSHYNDINGMNLISDDLNHTRFCSFKIHFLRGGDTLSTIPKLLECVRNGELRVSDFNLGGPNMIRSI